MKKKIAFIDHNFHQKTRSGDFLREILKREFSIDDYWWSFRNKYNLINDVKQYDYFFFFQSLLPLEDLLKIKDKQIIWAPMYDNLDKSKNFWKKIKFLNIKILSFSDPIKKLCEKYGCNYLSLKFAKKEKFIKSKNKKKVNIFFWYRNNVSIYDWIDCFNIKDINQILYLDRPDPGRESEKINSQDLRKYKIKLIKKDFFSKTKYLKLIKNCDVFVCSRKQEGIGMSFIEALAMGKYLIFHNDYTMKEYVKDKKIGLSIPRNLSKKIDTTLILKSYKYRYFHAIDLYNNWSKNKNKLIEFCNNNRKSDFNNPIYYFYFLKDYLKKIKFYFDNLLT